MIAIVFGAVIFDRSAISLRTFALAMIAVVLLQPDSVVTPGFQMSFAATGALIAAFEVWRNRRSGKDGVLGPIAFSWVSIAVTSLVAGLATMPFATYHFDRASPIGFIATLAATPVVTFLSAPSAALALVLAPFGLSDFGLRLFGYSLELLLIISHFFAQFSGEAGYSSRAMPASSMVLSALALAALISATGAARYVLSGILATASIGLWMLAPQFVAHWSTSGDLFLAQPNDDVIRIELADGDGLAPLRFSETLPASCEGTGCSSNVPSQVRLTVDTIPEPVACFQRRSELASETPAACDAKRSEGQVIWLWPDIAKHGGVTLYVKDGAFHEVRAPACGRRPWHPCLQNENIREE